MRQSNDATLLRMRSIGSSKVTKMQGSPSVGEAVDQGLEREDRLAGPCGPDNRRQSARAAALRG